MIPGLARLHAFRAQHARSEILLFFGLGLGFDAVTLGRIDDLIGLFQQALFLAALGFLLALDQRKALLGVEPPGLLARGWRFSEDAIHFLFGSLLSGYALFYSKSAGGLHSLAFVALVGSLLFANELPHFRRLGPPVRFALFGFCISSYFAYVIPVLVGFLRSWLFAVATLLGAGSGWLLYRLLRRWGVEKRTALFRVLLPAVAVQVLLLGLHGFRMIPPVPLAVKQIGIYHKVEREGAGYVLWRRPRVGGLFTALAEWIQPTFTARPGDAIYCYARIFAPARFSDEVRVRWSYQDPRWGWQTWDAIPMKIAGGREEGFRGYAFKQNYAPGKWRVAVETEGGREIGTLTFTVVPDPEAEPRAFEVERG
jgi:hypothetical protein